MGLYDYCMSETCWSGGHATTWSADKQTVEWPQCQRPDSLSELSIITESRLLQPITTDHCPVETAHCSLCPAVLSGWCRRILAAQSTHQTCYGYCRAGHQVSTVIMCSYVSAGRYYDRTRLLVGWFVRSFVTLVVISRKYKSDFHQLWCWCWHRCWSSVSNFTVKGAITSKIKHAIKLETSPARLAQLLQPSLAFCFSLQPVVQVLQDLF